MVGSAHARSSARRNAADLWAIVALIVVPLAVFGITALCGHPQIPGDNVVQNYPLRVLVGQQLRRGTLPVYNPYIWGGAPLLGGWNAGALYPFTFLFAVLPGAGAWTLNVLAVYWVAAVGLYAFLRTVGLRPVPSALGAASFSFAGAMDVHLSHFGLVAGMSWIPVILLAIAKLEGTHTIAHQARWAGVLAVAVGMNILAGEPRAIDTMVIVAVIFFAWSALRRGPHLGRFVVSVVLGAGAAVLVGAVQWIPGSMAVATSQRAVNSYALYGFGSLTPSWVSLLLAPGLLGGSGSFGTSAWFASNNLPEVMGYVGLLPVIGAAGLLGTMRRRGPLPEWFIWQIIAVVGFVLAIGTYTPLGVVLTHVPLFGDQRLQSRNIAITDLALAVLFAYWLDHLLERGVGIRVRSAGRWIAGRAARVPLIPVVLAAVLGMASLVSPSTVARLLGVPASQAGQAGGQRPVLAAGLVIALLAGLLVLRLPTLSRARLPWLVGAFVALDIVVFNLVSVWTVDPAASAPTVFPAGTAAVPLPAPPDLGREGRFALFDPDLVDWPTIKRLGQPDLNVLDERFSVQGYSSIVDANYAIATGSHGASGEGTDTLAPAALNDGVLDQLDTTALVTTPAYLLVPVAPGTPPVPPGVPATVPGSTTPGGGARYLPERGGAVWVFGEDLKVSSVSVQWVPRSPDARPSFRVALEEPGGRFAAAAVTVEPGPHRVATIRLVRPARAIGVRVEPAGAGVLGSPVIATTSGTAFAAIGALQDALAAGRWSFTGNVGVLSIFTNSHALPPLTLRAVGGQSLVGARVRALSGPAIAPSAAAVSSTSGTEVVRSVTPIPGWSATWRPTGGAPPRTLAVQGLGVVQMVQVPPGSGILTWHYAAPGIHPGLWFTLVGCLLVLLSWVLPRVAGSARRRRGPTMATTPPRPRMTTRSPA